MFDRRRISVIVGRFHLDLHSSIAESRKTALSWPRQLLDKRNGCPDYFITVIAPGRYAGHLDAVLDDAEELGWGVEVGRFG